MNVLPPNNNNERYLAAVLDELKVIREILDRLLSAALERPDTTPRPRRPQ